MKTSTTCPNCRKSTLNIVNVRNDRSGWSTTKMACPCCKARYARCIDHAAPVVASAAQKAN